MRWLAALAYAALAYLLSTFLIKTSAAQQKADLEGSGNGSICIQDSTSGHGYNGGALRILTGVAPADADAAETGTLLVAIALPNPLFGAATAALPSVCTANAISDATITATGTAGYGRMVPVGDTGVSSTTERRIQFDVGTSGASMNFNTLALVSGGSVSTTSLTMTHGA